MNVNKLVSNLLEKGNSLPDSDASLSLSGESVASS